jgi:hypothetical protein
VSVSRVVVIQGHSIFERQVAGVRVIFVLVVRAQQRGVEVIGLRVVRRAVGNSIERSIACAAQTIRRSSDTDLSDQKQHGFPEKVVIFLASTLLEQHLFQLEQANLCQHQ